MNIPVKRFDKEFPLPQYDNDAACFDLVCRETVTIPPHKIGGVHQNIALQIPTGYALLLFGRSSTPIGKGLILANGVGVIDPFYRGDKDENVAFLLNITDNPVTVKAGDKIVQGMIIKTEPVTWSEVESFPDNGIGGYRYRDNNGEVVSLT